ncbi:NNMT/PNMT/TEMT family class I SAM-dependent methyltransferase [Dactylosporangium sp. NBC_01737]|uniref:guanitoxin biosynthesis pre-guanitoxin forming N-methyltransferase GntF n=1 Tax=Dactylosporangium sp. NBC_01737 TaxID=2975959 RepID=UPI002E16724D|nr:NNMT/PNMT/TEMT family class I SAM-dependent methyltransferase [Dactylosporangium sp. NBC_01737]
MTGGRRGRGLRAWAVSLAATAVSAYALDATATAAGVALVASGLLGDLGHRWALAVLAASYAVWAWGLRANLRANQSLLTATGTSTNVLSKAAHDLTRRRTASPRAARVAAAAGYAATEVAKEVPYYAGAFGAAVLTDSVTATGALLFLAGANIGAAGYEYGLARLTTVFLRHRRRRYASFDADWDPAAYLDGYYRTVEPDEVATIAFFVDALRGAERDRPVLFFGVGPTLHHVFAAAEIASEIHLGDYLPGNLAQIRRWLDRDPDAHDWRPFVRHTLRCEGNPDPTDEEVTAREDLTRKKITDLVEVDARHPRPVRRCYPTVVSAYCADSATADRATWALFMRHITGLVEPGGLFVTSALRRCRGYTVGGRSFPSADVDEHDLRAVLRPGFATPAIEVTRVPQETTHGYAGIVLCHARRR